MVIKLTAETYKVTIESRCRKKNFGFESFFISFDIEKNKMAKIIKIGNVNTICLYYNMRKDASLARIKIQIHITIALKTCLL